MSFSAAAAVFTASLTTRLRFLTADIAGSKTLGVSASGSCLLLPGRRRARSSRGQVLLGLSHGSEGLLYRLAGWRLDDSDADQGRGYEDGGIRHEEQRMCQVKLI